MTVWESFKEAVYGVFVTEPFWRDPLFWLGTLGLFILGMMLKAVQ